MAQRGRKRRSFGESGQTFLTPDNITDLCSQLLMDSCVPRVFTGVKKLEGRVCKTSILTNLRLVSELFAIANVTTL